MSLYNGCLVLVYTGVLASQIRMKGFLTFIALLCFSACATQQATYPQTLESIQEELQSLSQRINASIAYPRCDSFTDCGVIATGYAPCGRPDRYVAYSKQLPTATNLRNLALRRVRLERDYNVAANISGVCQIEIQPSVNCRAGVCKKVER